MYLELSFVDESRRGELDEMKMSSRPEGRMSSEKMWGSPSGLLFILGMKIVERFVQWLAPALTRRAEQLCKPLNEPS
jgi:hypothetical protein